MKRDILIGLFLVAVLALIVSAVDYSQVAKQGDPVPMLRPHCKTVNAMVIEEVTASMERIQYSTEAQQDSWKRLTAGCAE
jgi:hypothetical protein